MCIRVSEIEKLRTLFETRTVDRSFESSREGIAKSFSIPSVSFDETAVRVIAAHRRLSFRLLFGKFPA